MNFDWDENEELKKENQELRKKLNLGENEHHNLNDLDPKTENQFLRNMLAYEEMENGVQIKILTLFPIDFNFIPENELSDEALSDKFDEILDVLARHNIYLSLVSDCPERIAYQYVLDEVLKMETPVTYPEDMQHVIDGCGGWCPDCFQLPYCDSAKETWTEDELKEYQEGDE